MKKPSQLSLFPEPKFVSPSEVELSKTEIKERLEDIALKACQESLLFGEDSVHSQKETTYPEKRLARILSYIGQEIPANLYLIQYDKKIIGAAYVWDGWLPVEAEYCDPSVEVALIDPNYKEHGPLIIRKSADFLEEVRENRD